MADTLVEQFSDIMVYLVISIKIDMNSLCGSLDNKSPTGYFAHVYVVAPAVSFASVIPRCPLCLPV